LDTVRNQGLSGVTSRRLKYLIGALASSIVLLLFGAAIHYSASAQQPGPQWTVTGSMGAHHMLVVSVTARPGASLHDIGESIVKPVVGQYDEILIYVRSGKSTLRRIQWTPQHGYVELVIS
jgi:hypothetical protein